MASNSKKRRRVLGVSCILAALIIASSSFAWFTSRDEVTNRLSANADYDVSIVESFAPPENWLPGQKVTKEVYAVNTGDIPAYVRERVSGALTITREEAVASDQFNTQKAELTTLTKAERYVTEAGSYLALKPAADTANNTGDLIVSMVPSGTDLDGYVGDATSFTPAAEGLYVFRRTIDVASPSGNETFDTDNYVGYYYDGTSKFYKVDLTSVTPDNPIDYPDVANDGIKTDGNLLDATYTFAKDVKKVVDPTSLSYDAANKRLVVTYKGQTSTVDSTTMNQLADDLDEAWHNFDKATEMLRKATAGNTAAEAAIAAAQATANTKKAEYDALVAEKNAKTTQLAGVNEQITYWEAQKTQAKNDRDAAYSALYGTGDETNPDDGTLKNTLDNKTTALSAALANDADRTAFYTEFRDYVASLGSSNTPDLPNGWNNSSDSNYVSDANLINYLTYDQVKGFSNYAYTTEAHTIYEATIEKMDAEKAYNDKLAQYNGYVSAYNTAVTTLGGDPRPTTGSAPDNSLYNTADALNARLTELGDDTTAGTLIGDKYTEWQDAINAVTQAATVAGETGTAAANLTEAKTNFDEKYEAYYKAKSAYDTAVASYNTSNADLKIYVNLSDNVGTAATANGWQLLPNPIANDEAVFYYNGILEGGETSSMLIKSVELDSGATQDMYKSFDFDLNVALDSAQIVYDADQKTILTTPAKENFSTSTTSGQTTTTTTVDATLGTATDLDTLVTWTSNTVNQTTTP